MLSTLRKPSVMQKIGMSVSSAGDLPAGKALVTKNGETEVVKCPFPNCKVCVIKRKLVKKEEEKQKKQNNVTFQIKEMSDATEPAAAPAAEPAAEPAAAPAAAAAPETEAPGSRTSRYNVSETSDTLNDTAKRLTNYNIENQNDALNVIVGFIGLAQTRGAFSIEEAAKLHECIKLFRA